MADDAALTGVEAVIAAYRTRWMPEAAAVFARTVVASVTPTSPARAKALLWACCRLATFGLGVGLDPEATVLLHPSVIERLVLVGAGDLSGAGRRTLRTNLRWMASRISAAPTPTALSRERAKAAYTAAEIAAYLALADAQPTPARRMRAAGLIALGAGAGLMGADLRHVRGTDVVARSGGLVVVVGGQRPRVVPVLVRYHDRLIASADFAAGGWVIGGTDPNRRNVTTALISSLSGGIDLACLQTCRLRSTWLSEVAANIGIATFLAAAGVSCTQRLGDLVADIAPGGEAEAVKLLGAGP